MKTKIFLFLLLLAALCSACRSSNRDAQALYDRYAVRENLTVSYVEGYHRDSIRGDFVILEAQDTATWFALAKEFGIPRSMAVREGNVNMQYIIGYMDRKDPTQAPPLTTLPSGKQLADLEQSCSRVVDVFNQRIFLIFAEDKESYNLIENRIISNL